MGLEVDCGHAQNIEETFCPTTTLYDSLCALQEQSEVYLWFCRFLP